MVIGGKPEEGKHLINDYECVESQWESIVEHIIYKQDFKDGLELKNLMAI